MLVPEEEFAAQNMYTHLHIDLSLINISDFNK